MSVTDGDGLDNAETSRIPQDDVDRFICLKTTREQEATWKRKHERLKKQQTGDEFECDEHAETPHTHELEREQTKRNDQKTKKKR